jgi:pimeloyl-ACP methyl ester carboxylesterase
MARLTTDDGRTLEYLVTGPADGLAMVLHHGTPGAAVPFAPMVDAATRRGVRTILYSRPGYGRSDPSPGRAVADAAADVRAILDEVGVDRFVTVGWSGGGPHALATARLLPDRCAAAALIAGVAPYAAEGLDWLSGMGQDNHDEFGAALAGRQPLTDYLAREAATLATVRGAEVAAALGDLVSDVDKAQLTGGFAEYLAASFRTAVAPGIAGWRDDDLAFVRDWGVPLDGPVPVALWQGDQDRMVPYAHGEWLAAHVAGVRVHLLPGEGHLSVLVGTFEAIVADLVDLSARPV